MPSKDTGLRLLDSASNDQSPKGPVEHWANRWLVWILELAPFRYLRNPYFSVPFCVGTKLILVTEENEVRAEIILTHL